MRYLKAGVLLVAMALVSVANDAMSQGVIWTRTQTIATPTFISQGLTVIGDDLLTFTGKQLYRSTDRGDTWSKICDQLDSVQLNSILFGPTVWYALASVPHTTDIQAIYRSMDSGITWHRGSNLILGPVSGSDAGLVVSGWDGSIFISNDRGDSWTYLPSWSGYDNSITISMEDSLTLACADSSSILSLNLSTDALHTSHRLAVPDSVVNAFTVDSQYLFVCTPKGTYRSRDSGVSWGKLTEYPIIRLWAHGKDIVGVSVGNDLVLSQDWGLSWVSIKGGLPNVGINSVAIGSRELYLAAQGGYIYRARLPQASVVDAFSPSTELRPTVFPNPADDHITIRYDRLMRSLVPMVFNASGERVPCAMRDGVSRTAYDVSLDVSLLAPGVYTVSIPNGKATPLTRFVVSR